MHDGKTLTEYHRQTYRLENIIAVCPAMREVVATAKRVVDVPKANVLLIGETGTGKDLLAKCLHYSSQRWSEPFVTINCAAIPDTLLESELFGYEAGAFTDAKGRKRGLLEIAAEGTIYLNEVAEMGPNIQAKLLTAIEDLAFYRLGGTELIRFNARIIAATNRNVSYAIQDRSFRRDLYYRLNTISLHLPPLRERQEDILPLAQHFVREMCARHERTPIPQLSPGAVEILRKHSWPGNVRELRQVIERAVILHQGSRIEAEDIIVDAIPLDPGIQVSETGQIRIEMPPDGIPLETVERMLIESALKAAHGVQVKAAQLLHISRDTLRYRMQKYGLTDADTSDPS